MLLCVYVCVYHFKVACRFTPKCFTIHVLRITAFSYITLPLSYTRKLIIISYYYLISCSYSNFPNCSKKCFVAGFVNLHPNSVQKLHYLCILTLFYSKIAPSPLLSNKVFFSWLWYCFSKEIRPVAFYIVLYSGFVWLFPWSIIWFASLISVFSLNWEISLKAWLY